MSTTTDQLYAQGIFLMREQLEPQGPELWVDPDVLALDAAGTLARVVAEQAREDAAAAEKMRAVTHWADLHRVAEDDFLLEGAVDRDLLEVLEDRPVMGLEGVLRLAGEGAFMVAEFAVCELAAALGMSEPAARGYVGQSVELRDRLPRLWARVMDGTLAAWRARLVAKETIPLNAAAAAYVDAQLAPFAHKVSPWRVLKAVEAAVLRHDPELAARRAATAAEQRGVWLEDRLDRTTQINAVPATPDATAFDAALDSVATTLAGLGDTAPRDVRRAKAIGVLADPQYALDLVTTA